MALWRRRPAPGPIPPGRQTSLPEDLSHSAYPLPAACTGRHADSIIPGNFRRKAAKNGHDPQGSCPSSDTAEKAARYCAACGLPCPLPLPRTGMVAPVLFMMKVTARGDRIVPRPLSPSAYDYGQHGNYALHADKTTRPVAFSETPLLKGCPAPSYGVTL